MKQDIKEIQRTIANEQDEQMLQHTIELIWLPDGNQMILQIEVERNSLTLTESWKQVQYLTTELAHYNKEQNFWLTTEIQHDWEC